MNQGSGGTMAVAIIVVTILFGVSEFIGLNDAKEAAQAILKALSSTR